MKHKKIIAFLVFVILALSQTSLIFANPDFKVTSSFDNGKLNLSWENPYGDSIYYPYAYKLRKSSDGGKTYKNISMWTENDEVQVLNIYPDTNYNVEYQFKDGTRIVSSKAAALKIWMEGGTMIEGGVATQFDNYGRDIVSGRQLIKVDPVAYSQYNSNPDAYLKDSNGKYKYDVIAFGTWDASNWQDLSQAGADAVAKFIESGRGAFFGHDTLYSGTSPVTFSTLAPYVGVTPARDTVSQYSGEVGSESGKGGIDSKNYSQVKIVSKSTLTSYPWNIGDVGTILTVPGAHNLQSANGQILMRFHHPSYTDADNVPENFFLTLNNNTAMSQTGHSIGNSTDDERKILANTLFYLKQVSTAEFATDTDVTDDVSPSNLSMDKVGCGTTDEYKLVLKLNAQDDGKPYQYYIEGIPQIAGHGSDVSSNVITAKATSGIDSYWYTINYSDSAVGKPSASAAGWNTANTNSSYQFTTPTLDYTKTAYVHFFAKDKYGNVSEEKTAQIKSNNAPIISIPSKSFYEGQYTLEEYQNDIRDADLLATDMEDGIITSNVQFISDTTDVNKPGLYEVKYKVQDNDCITVTKTNKIEVKFNNPPTLTKIKKTYYENEITKEEWVNSLRMQDITASDIEDGNITPSIKMTSDNVDLKKAGIYQVRYNVYDQWGKFAETEAEVEIKYNNPPEISAYDKVIMENQYSRKEWEDALLRKSIIATDIEDGDITNQIEILYDNVNPSQPGWYKVTYAVTDKWGKETQKSINVNVKYNVPPIINANNVIIHENEISNEDLLKQILDNTTATDHEDGDTTKDLVVIKNTIDTSKVGSYEIIFKVTDSLGKTTKKSIDITVLENYAPTLQIFAESKRFVEGEFTQNEWNIERMNDVTAHDREDMDLSDKVIVISDKTDINKAGTYELTYEVTDRWNKSTTKAIIVTVEENKAPEIFASDKWFSNLDTISDNDLLRNIVSMDDHDGNISDKITIKSTNVEVGKVGEYDVIYTVADRFGKRTDKAIKVYISESEISINPPIPPDFKPNTLPVWNGRQIGKIEITKIMEEYDIHPDAYKNVTFGVFTDENLYHQGKVILEKDKLVGIIKINSSDKGSTYINQSGKYYIKELNTDESFVLSDKKYYFEFNYK